MDEVEEFGVGGRMTGVTPELRAGYHIAREVVPYIGATWRGQFGDKADLAEMEGEEAGSSAVGAGVRRWF